MDQQAVTWVVAGVFVALLALSYVRYRRHGGEGGQTGGQDAPTVRQTMDEVREYFDLPTRDGKGNLARTFDLAPMEMLAGMGASSGKGKRPRKDGGAKERK